MITVQLLGGACLRSGDTALGGPAVQRHRIALLTLLVASWPRPLARDRAMALLWPERDLANARRLLNLAVHVLRAALGAGAITTTGDGLLFDPAHLPCDLHDLRSAIAGENDDAVAGLAAAPLLDGFHLADSVELGYWLDERRAELARAYVDALRRIAERQERRGDAQGRVGTCLRLVAADPHSGAYARALMHALDAAGDRAAALQHARDHARRRWVDLELGPDAEVAALADRLRAASPPARSVVSLRDRSRAVADGITEDVAAQRSKIRALEAIARIVASLLDGEHDRQIWAETYARQSADVLSVQSDVAVRIAAALQSA